MRNDEAGAGQGTGGAILRVGDLHVSYGNLHAVRGVTLFVRPGELCALVGPNGSGKSSTLRAVQGLLPSRGMVWFRGERVDGLPAHERVRRGVASIPERRRLFGEMTVRENLELGAFRAGARARVAEAVAMVHRLFPPLQAKAGARAWTLSGGEQQMLSVARALMAWPDLLLMDDPFMGLAPRLIEGLCEVIHTIAAHGVAVLIAGQHVRRILTLAQRAYLMEGGRISAEDTGGELLASRTLRRALLET